MRALLIAAMLLAPTQTHALEIGARLPTSDSELIVIRNDGGIRNATDYFGYGTVCRADLNLRTWLVVKRIVGDRALVEVDLNVALTGLSCPHGTETSMPYAQARNDTKTTSARSMIKSSSISEGANDIRADHRGRAVPTNARARVGYRHSHADQVRRGIRGPQ